MSRSKDFKFTFMAFKQQHKKSWITILSHLRIWSMANIFGQHLDVWSSFSICGRHFLSAADILICDRHLLSVADISYLWSTFLIRGRQFLLADIFCGQHFFLFTAYIFYLWPKFWSLAYISYPFLSTFLICATDTSYLRPTFLICGRHFSPVADISYLWPTFLICGRHFVLSPKCTALKNKLVCK